MTQGGTDYPFALFAPGILSELGNQERFIEVMTEFYTAVAGTHDCYITVSERRFADAHDYWLEDAERMMLMSDDGTVTLDHFKHGAMIAFWLRRMVPINDLYFCNDNASAKAQGKRKINPDMVSERQANFAQYGSERCALLSGFYICLSYEVQKAESERENCDNLLVLGQAGTPSGELPPQFTEEYPMLMKTKNISGHGLYMMYRALFADTRWRVKDANIT